MKKEIYINISNVIGYANWIIVTLIFIIILTNSQKIPYIIANFLGHYLTYSFVPALISIIIAVIVNRGFKGSNIIANLVFLVLYVLAFMFSKYMSMFG